MANPQSDYEFEGEIPYHLIYGVHVKLDGGEEDTTIRPAMLSKTLRAQKGLPPPPIKSDKRNKKQKTSRKKSVR
jgi:hypothetical protein